MVKNPVDRMYHIACGLSVTPELDGTLCLVN
jgi:hypothetical protein